MPGAELQADDLVWVVSIDIEGRIVTVRHDVRGVPIYDVQLAVGGTQICRASELVKIGPW
jgi:hypothetical protein